MKDNWNIEYSPKSRCCRVNTIQATSEGGVVYYTCKKCNDICDVFHCRQGFLKELRNHSDEE